ncbi:phosphoadenosine phosphosulfate reductase domain-containing protein [Longitalea luteola]|uniref:phosphoadenosine phosphosulfate reductase domain-containing protein n=1 Tax=Longitalea luteola TaxID=2812563 RepID=UPI001A96A127|nr:phosphoadenosine phosphosulfate reductase family protein [Longitalea luteola]
MKERLLISFSGGRTSAFMTHWLLQNKSGQFEMMVVFANTGKEREETLQFVDQCDKILGFQVHWIEAVTSLEPGKGVSARKVDFNNASRKGEPFESFIQKHGIPNLGAPKCSRELKAYAIRAYARSLGWKKYYTGIGIRYDEAGRINLRTAKHERLVYPLAQWLKVTKSDVNLFWSRQAFDLQLKSYEGNCDLCWKKSNRKLITILKENPHLADWWREMENRYGTYVPEKSKGNLNIKLPVRFFRDYRSVDDLLHEASFEHRLAVDDSKTIDPYKQLPLFDPCLDCETGACADSCEAF